MYKIFSTFALFASTIFLNHEVLVFGLYRDNKFMHFIDMPVHALGGATLAMFACVVCDHFHVERKVIPTLILIGLVSILWETKEYYDGLAHLEGKFYFFNVVKDTSMNFLGGLCSLWFLKKNGRYE